MTVTLTHYFHTTASPYATVHTTLIHLINKQGLSVCPRASYWIYPSHTFFIFPHFPPCVYVIINITPITLQYNHPFRICDTTGLTILLATLLSHRTSSRIHQTHSYHSSVTLSCFRSGSFEHELHIFLPPRACSQF